MAVSILSQEKESELLQAVLSEVSPMLISVSEDEALANLLQWIAENGVNHSDQEIIAYVSQLCI